MRADKITITHDPKHLLLIGPTKFGKTHYSVAAANAGYELLYIDKDNGLTTIRKDATSDGLSRIHHFNPPSMIDFVEKLLMSEVVRWNTRINDEYASRTALPDDEIVEIYPMRMDKGVILVLDTWTSLAWSALEAKAKDLNIDLTDVDKWGREVYGTSGFRLTRIAKILQTSPFHQIVMAHNQYYELKEKPPGIVQAVKEKDMIIRGTVEIPVSSSGPHGYSIGPYFNEIGHLVLNNLEKRAIDFTLKKGRLGAGTPNAILDPNDAGSWAALWGKPPVRDPNTKPWIDYFSAKDFEARRAAVAANAPRLSTLGAKMK